MDAAVLSDPGLGTCPPGRRSTPAAAFVSSGNDIGVSQILTTAPEPVATPPTRRASEPGPCLSSLRPTLVDDPMVMYSRGMESEARTIGDVAVHVAGSGPSLVLLHANGGSHHDFDAIAEALAAHAKVFAIDWPGHGDSSDAIEPGACAFADLLPSLLENIDEGPYTLVGNSVGGFAAIRTAARRPDLVKSLVIINPGGFTPRWPGTLLFCRLFGSERVAPLAMRLLPRFYLRRTTPAVETIRRSAVAASHDPKMVRTFARTWRSFTDRHHDARVDASMLDVPVLLLWGSRDPILPWFIDGRRARRAFRNARVETLPCGHQSFAEMTTEFTTILSDFLGWSERQSTW